MFVSARPKTHLCTKVKRPYLYFPTLTTQHAIGVQDQKKSFLFCWTVRQKVSQTWETVRVVVTHSHGQGDVGVVVKTTTVIRNKVGKNICISLYSNVTIKHKGIIG